MAQLCVGNQNGIGRRFQFCGCRGQRAIGEDSLRWRMNHCSVTGDALRYRNLPRVRRGLNQHGADGGSGLAQRQIVGADCAAAASDVGDGSRRSSDGLDGGPGHHQFFSGKLRQPGHGSLAEFAAAEEHSYRAVDADLDIRVYRGGWGCRSCREGNAGQSRQAELQHKAAGGADDELPSAGPYGGCMSYFNFFDRGHGECSCRCASWK